MNQEKRKKTETTNIRNGRGNITNDSTDFIRIIRKYYNNFMPINLKA